MGGLLTDQQVDQFNDEGYLLVEGVLDPELDLDPIIAEYDGVLDRLADELFDSGEIASKYEDEPFGTRLSKIYQESGKVHAQYFDFSLPQKGIQHDTPFWTGPAVFSALTNEKLLDTAESIIGPEIYSNPVQHVRIKPPEAIVPKDPETGRPMLGATQAHQDNGVVNEEADGTQMLTIWFSLLDAPTRAGCLRVAPGSHRQGLLPHCPAGTNKNKKGGLQIPEEYYDEDGMVPVPTKRGDVLLLTARTVHDSLPNVSDNIRWSFDLRYNPIGQPTGRGSFPGFVARSAQDPSSQLRDSETWTQLWAEARAFLAENPEPTFNRWNADDYSCA
jgi:phytanoyl-CoA hydroxylase